MKFGEYLRKAREKAGWTQPEAATRIGVEQSYLSKLEAGKSYPSEDVFDQLVTAYSLDVDNMSSTVTSSELDKLREIGSVRDAILQQQNTKTRFQRGWMLLGLIMIICGSGMLVSQSERTDTYLTTYRYESAGIIKPDEPLRIIEWLEDQEQKMAKTCQKNLSGLEPADSKITKVCSELGTRINYDILHTEEYLGPVFIRNTEDGNRRRYELKAETDVKQESWLNYLFAYGIGLLIGGFISCFYISAHWR